MKRLLPIIGLFTLPAFAGGPIFDHGFENPTTTFPPVTIAVVDTLAVSTPCGVAIAQIAGGTYALIGSHGSNEVHSYALDRDTGGLTAAGSASTGGVGPAAIEVNGNWVIVANELDDTVTVLELDPGTGKLSSAHAPLSTSPGFRPAMVAVTDGGYVAVGNRNGILNVYQQNPDGALVTYIAAEPLGTAMEDMADGPDDTLLVADPIDGNAVLYQIIPGNMVSTLDSVSLSDPVRVAHSGDRVYVAAFDMSGINEILAFEVIGGTSLSAIGEPSFPSATITKLTVASDNARLLVAHSEPPIFDDELSALAPTDSGLEDIGSGILGTGFTVRNIASVAGSEPGVEFAVVTRFDLDQTVVVKIEE